MIVRTVFTITALALGLALPVTAATQLSSRPPNDAVNLSIPVHLAQIPSGITTFTVECSFRYVGQSGVVGNGTEHNRVDRPLVNGNYDGIVQMTLKLGASAPSAVGGYTCDLWLRPAAGLGVKPGPTSSNAQARPAPGTQFVGHIEGGF